MDDAEYAAAYNKYGGSFLTNDTTQTLFKAGASLDQVNALTGGVKDLPAAGGGNVKDWQKLISAANSDMPKSAKDEYYRSVIKSDSTWDEWKEAEKAGKTMAEWCAEHYTGESSHFTTSSQYVLGGKK